MVLTRLTAANFPLKQPSPRPSTLQLTFLLMELNEWGLLLPGSTFTEPPPPWKVESAFPLALSTVTVTLTPIRLGATLHPSLVLTNVRPQGVSLFKVDPPNPMSPLVGRVVLRLPTSRLGLFPTTSTLIVQDSFPLQKFLSVMVQATIGILFLYVFITWKWWKRLPLNAVLII